MKSKKGIRLWVVVPYAWMFDSCDNPSISGYDCPRFCFTFKKVAEDWIREKSIVRFKAIASQKNFDGYLNVESLENSLSWSVNRLLDKRWKKYELGEISQDEYYSYLNSEKFSEEKNDFIENFLSKWKIDKKEMLIKKEDVSKMKDEDILSFLEEVDLVFYTAKPVKIIC